jgi:hypothetical protein
MNARERIGVRQYTVKKMSVTNERARTNISLREF